MKANSLEERKNCALMSRTQCLGPVLEKLVVLADVQKVTLEFFWYMPGEKEVAQKPCSA